MRLELSSWPRGIARRAVALRRVSSWLSMVLALLAWPTVAQALVERPVTADGPAPEIAAVEGTALASDGTGGVVYLKREEGVPHVFVVRRLHGGWSFPLRVDRIPWEASQPRIAAGDRGRLLVVWVSQIRTVHGTVRRALYSAELGPRASTFGETLVVDSNVGDGRGTEPSLAGAEPGRGIVVYRVTTNDLTAVGGFQPPQLRPGDVLADIRVARYQGTRWSRLGPINRNTEASMPPGGEATAPRVGLASDGSAVVAWLERDQSLAARIWARRIFGTSPGPILLASPTSWEGKQVGEDADGLALAVSPLGMAQVVSRIPTASGDGTRLFVNQLPPRVTEGAADFTGPVQIADPIAGPAGLPSVAVAEDGTDNGTRIAFTAGGAIRTAAFGSAKPLSDSSPSPAPTSAEVQIGHSLTGASLAWATTGADGLPAVAVRQEGTNGAQTGMLAGAEAGDVSELRMAANESGDAIVAFLQSAGINHQVVAAGISGAPSSFTVDAPRSWVRPPAAKLHWTAPASTSPNLTYTILLDGRPVGEVGRRAFLPSPATLGSGVRRVRVVASDDEDQTVVSRPVKLKVDARPPSARVRQLRHARSPHTVLVKLSDPDSGLALGAAVCAFGDGRRKRRGRTYRHSYSRPGLYTVLVKAKDRVGNRTTLRIPVRVR